MEVLSKTLKNYKNTYANRLAKYLDNYEDNSELLFLQRELKSCAETLETLNTYKANSKTFGFITLKDHFDISILENLGFNLEKVDNHISSMILIMDFINEKIQKSKNSSATEKPKYIDMSESDRDKHEDPTDKDENDYTKSTIEDCLYDIKDHIDSEQYETLVDTLYYYFTTGQFTKLKKKIMFKRVNKKKVGWALKEAYINLKTDKLSIEYFEFAKENISLFEKEQIESENFRQSKFYKYFTTNPNK